EIDPSSPTENGESPIYLAWGGVGIATYGGDANAITFIANRVWGDAGAHKNILPRVDEQEYEIGQRVKSQWSVDGDQTLLFTIFECVDVRDDAKTAATEPEGFRNYDNYALGAPFWNEWRDANVKWKAISCPPNYGFYDRGFEGNAHFGDLSENTSGPGFA